MSRKGQNTTLENLKKQREVLANLIKKIGKDSEVTRLQKIQILEIEAGLRKKGIDPGTPVPKFSPREELAALEVRRQRVAKDNLQNVPWTEARERSSHNVPPMRTPLNPMIAPLNRPKETPRKRGKRPL